MKSPDIFAYLDYRKFLGDAFAALKSDGSKVGPGRSKSERGRSKSGQDRAVSFRSFAKEAGYTSPNFLQLVIAGKRDLALGQLPGTIRALGLNKQQAEFFSNLVGFDQAEGFEEKNFHYQKMLRSRRFSVAKPVEKTKFEYFDQWYHPAVRELLMHAEFKGDLNWIAERLQPRLTVSQVEKSVHLLESLGLIKKDEASGRWLQTESVLSTAPEVASLAVANYHRALLKLASDSIEAFPQSERDLRSVTLGLPASAFPELKRRLEDFWRDLLALSETQKGVEEVLQINLQLFPLTQKGNGSTDGQ